MTQFDQHLLANGTCVIEATGEVDLAVVDELLEIARSALSRADAMHLDLGKVAFIDSTGLGALVLIRNEAVASGTSLRLVNVPASVSRLLLLTGLADAFDIHPDGAADGARPAVAPTDRP